MAKSPLSKRPKTPMELPGEDRGGDPSPRPAMRERERVVESRLHLCFCLFIPLHKHEVCLSVCVSVYMSVCLSVLGDDKA